MFALVEADRGDQGGIKRCLTAVDQLVKEGTLFVILLTAATERLFTFLQVFRCFYGAIFERQRSQFLTLVV